MAEFVIRVRERRDFDPVRQAASLRPGDVVDIGPDGFDWGALTMTNSDWRIVKCPGLSVDALLDMLAVATDANAKLLLKRAKAFDIENLLLKTEIDKLGQVITFEGAQKHTALLALKLTKQLQITVG